MNLSGVHLAVLERDEYRCAYCQGKRMMDRSSGVARTIDHILSKAEGRRQGIARDDKAWIVACCHRCNWRKGTRRLIPPSWAHRQAELEELTSKKWAVWSGDPRELGAEEVLR